MPGPSSSTATTEAIPTPIRVSELRFNGGTTVDTSRADIVVLVGPNNSGKSRTLQEIWALASHNFAYPFNRDGLVVLDGYSVNKNADTDAVSGWLAANRMLQVDPSTQREHVRAIGTGDFALDELNYHWGGNEHLGGLASQLFRFIGPGDARGLLGSPGRLEPRQIPDHVVQTLVRNPTTRRAFESAFRSAFGQNLIVDSWFSNTRLRLSRDLVQADFVHTSDDGLPSEDLADRLEALPLLESQSDGIRAFAGLLLTLISVRHPVLLLDEPETFLHPPQARLLGEYLGVLRGDGQLVVATHSLDIVLGLLQAAETRVMVVRLTRRDDRTSALTVDPDTVRALWRDSLLRFSRALDGLFHEGVVLYEGDTDSQFYSAVSYHLARSRHKAAGSAVPLTDQVDSDAYEFSANPFDVMFTYAGGKQRIKMIAKALSAVRVPVRCIVDFDALNSKAVLESIVVSLGHDYTAELERLRGIVDSGVRGNESVLTVGHLRERLDELLSGADSGAAAGSEVIRAIEDLLEPPSGWSAAKKKGKAEVPPGDSTAALCQLLEELRRRSVFVVPSGAVESWVKEVGGKGTAWVVSVIEGGYVESASGAQEFVTQVIESLTCD